MSDDLVERVAHELTGYIGSTCCHKTGGRSADPRCECRLLARAAIAVVLDEAADAVGEVGDHADLGAYINAIRALVTEPTDPGPASGSGF